MAEVNPYMIPNSSLRNKWTERMWKLDTAPHAIYVAAPLPNQGAALRLALQLQDAGFLVTSRWLRNDFSNKPSQDSWSKYVEVEDKFGRIDSEDLRDSDTLVILADQPSSSGGYHVELGYFLGAGKDNIIVVGDRPNVFYFTDHVRFATSVEYLVEWLQSPEHGTSLSIADDATSIKQTPLEPPIEGLAELKLHANRSLNLAVQVEQEKEEQEKLKSMADLVIKVPPGLGDDLGSDEGGPPF